jgi:hypothetical protein
VSSFGIHLSDESNNYSKLSSYAGFSRIVPTGMNNSGFM